MMDNIEDYYTDDVIIQRQEDAIPNGMGGFAVLWSTHLPIKGKMRPLSGTEQLSADKQTIFATHKLYCAIADITEMDRVVFEGDIYEIKNIPKDVMNMHNHFEIDLEFVK
jgi:SPP1 family predicted phage head-tail adaptor